MALSHLRTWQGRAFHSEVHDHRNRDFTRCRESGTRNWPDTFLSGSGRFCVWGSSTATERIRTPSVARSSHHSNHAIHAANGSRVSRSGGAGVEPPSSNSSIIGQDVPRLQQVKFCRPASAQGTSLVPRIAAEVVAPARTSASCQNLPFGHTAGRHHDLV